GFDQRKAALVGSWPGRPVHGCCPRIRRTVLTSITAPEGERTWILTSAGIQAGLSPDAFACWLIGPMSIRQRWPLVCPLDAPKAICARGGTSAAITERNVCISVTCCSSERTPRTLVDITEPIATIETATIASAISTSMIVKPAWRPSVGGVARNNLDPSGQPVDANFITDILTRQRHDAAAGHAGAKEADRRQRLAVVAGARQDGLETDVVRNADHVCARARADHAAAGIDQRGHAHSAPDRAIAVFLEQRRGLQHVALQARAGGVTREERQQDGRHDGDQRQHAYHFKQCEAALRRSTHFSR